MFRDAATSTFTAQVGSQWHKEAMSNGKCNKPWLLSPRMEGGRERGAEEAKNGANGEREQERERDSGSDPAAATGRKCKMPAKLKETHGSEM